MTIDKDTAGPIWIKSPRAVLITSPEREKLCGMCRRVSLRLGWLLREFPSNVQHRFEISRFEQNFVRSRLHGTFNDIRGAIEGGGDHDGNARETRI